MLWDYHAFALYRKSITPNDYFDTQHKPTRLSKRHGLCSL
jgi:hypothetical protein